MRVIAIVAVALSLSLVGCSASNTSSTPPTPTPNTTIYYDYFSSTLTPQVAVVSYPLTASSTPTLINGNGTNNLVEANSLLFDSSGNLWVASENNQSVIEYNGPFTATATLVPNITLTSGLASPTAIAFDGSGDLFVTNFGSAGTSS